MFELNDEALAREPRTEISALARFLGLPSGFDPLAVASSQTTSTASVWQVRQPVYQSSIGRWQAYARFIPELEGMQV